MLHTDSREGQLYCRDILSLTHCQVWNERNATKGAKAIVTPSGCTGSSRIFRPGRFMVATGCSEIITSCFTETRHVYESRRRIQ
jgi:hypothetical protein